MRRVICVHAYRACRSVPPPRPDSGFAYWGRRGETPGRNSCSARRSEPGSARRDPHRRLRRGNDEASSSLSRSRLRRSSVQSAARRRVVASRPERGRRGGRFLGQIRQFRRIRRVHARLADRRPAADEARSHDRGHRLLSQHLPRRRDPAGSRLLDPERHRLAQGQPDAELPRPPVHQCARDDDLGGARRRRPRPIRSITRP